MGWEKGKMNFNNLVKKLQEVSPRLNMFCPPCSSDFKHPIYATSCPHRCGGLTEVTVEPRFTFREHSKLKE